MRDPQCPPRVGNPVTQAGSRPVQEPIHLFPADVPPSDRPALGLARSRVGVWGSAHRWPGRLGVSRSSGRPAHQQGFSRTGMRILGNRRAAAGVVVALALGLTAPAALAAGPRAGATGVGPAPARQTLSLVLPLNANEAGLERFATEVNTPGSPDYGQYESIASLSRRFRGLAVGARAHAALPCDRSARRESGSTPPACSPTAPCPCCWPSAPLEPRCRAFTSPTPPGSSLPAASPTCRGPWPAR